jgi:CubicO group peptidase (beta-lactamase class C family)
MRHTNKPSMRRLIIFLLIPIAVNAQTNHSELLDKFMQAQSTVNQFSGTVIVVEKGKTIYEKAFGKADREWNIDNTIETKFRIGSNTKQFTAASILLLEEQGKLNIEDKLNKYIPNYPKGDSVTIQMLLNHTSGIRDYTQLPEFWAYAEQIPLAPDSMISLFKNVPYEFSPGTNFHYSNSGYFLLGFIIEKVSGQKYGDYLESNIINKIGLKNTGYDRLDSILQYRARGYNKTLYGFANAPHIAMEAPFSAGAIYSTIEDLYKWNKALMSNQILSASSTKKMTTAYSGHYGFGLNVDNFQNHSRLWHNGEIPGFKSAMVYFPTEDIFIAVLSNNESNATGVTDGLSDIMFDVPIEIPYIHKEISVDTKILDRYIGTYDGAFSFQIIKKDNKLYRYRPDRSDVELKPESLTKFFFADNSDRQIEFQISKANKVTKTFFINGGAKTEISKIK